MKAKTFALKSLALLTPTFQDRLPGSARWLKFVNLYLAPRVLFGYSGFPPSLTLSPDITQGSYSGSQRRLLYAFGPTSLSCATSVL